MSRKRQRDAEAQAAAPEQLDDQAPGARGAAQATDRRQGMAEIARRRAAHFANYVEGDDDDGQGNVHVGGTNARSLGMWSSAVELVNAREAAAAQREEKLQQAQRGGGGGAGEGDPDAIHWQPSRDPALGPRPPPDRVRPLFDLCVDLLVRHADEIASLWGVPDTIKVTLAAAMSAQRKMSPQAAQLFVDGAPTELALADCTQLDEPAMCELLNQCCSTRLERLDLGCCGRGFGDAAAAVVAANGPLDSLQSLQLHGAYRLTDEAVGKLLTACGGALQRLSLQDCPRLTGAALAALPQLAPLLECLELRGARGVDGQGVASAALQLGRLERLQLDGIVDVNDELLAVLASARSLRHLSINACQAVTDEGVAALAAGCPHLQTLYIEECAKVGDGGITALAAGCRELRDLSVRRCGKVTDAALKRLVENGGLQRLCVSGVPGVGPGTMTALAGSCRDSLRFLDVSFCRDVPERALGLVADGCPHLEEVHVYGCSQITRCFLHGHSNDRLRIEGVGTLGPAAGAP